MKKLLLFAGLPGVGKSTLSREVGKKVNAKIVDIDDFKKTEVDPSLVTNQIDPPELRWRYYQKALNHVFDLFDQGSSVVIMDEVFHLNSLRTQLEELCLQRFVQVFWVEVRCPYHVVEKRLRERIRSGHILSTEEALKMHLLFKEIFEDFPSHGKNHKIIDNENGTDLNLLVENVLGQ